MESIVGFESLKVHCIIGVEPREREHPQEISVDLKVKPDFIPSVLSDDLANAIDYTALAILCATVAQNKFFLLETYAAVVLEKVLMQYPVEWAAICVRKPGAIPNAACAFVELKARRRG